MSTHNLTQAEARQKIKALAESIDFALLLTALNQQPIHTVPMSTKQVDEEGCIWFLSSKQSDHNRHLEQDERCELHYANPASMEFLVLAGTARIETDKARLKELYGATDDVWFGGCDDPNLTAIRFKPATGHYWDSKHGKLISLLKMGAAAVTGSEANIGRHGELKV